MTGLDQLLIALSYMVHTGTVIGGIWLGWIILCRVIRTHAQRLDENERLRVEFDDLLDAWDEVDVLSKLRDAMKGRSMSDKRTTTAGRGF